MLNDLNAALSAQSAPSSESVLLELESLSHSYSGPEGRVPVLSQLSLLVRRGEFVAVLGQSGSGKSTLLNLIGGLERPTSGVLRVEGRDIASLSRQALETYRQTTVAFIFQFFNLLPALTAQENVLLALEAMDKPPADALERTRRYLASVGLDAKKDRFPAQLSGGEQQRVAIARALVRGAPLILADEPTGNLDEDTAAQVMELLVQVQRESGATVMLITHDDKVAARADRVLRLSHGRLVDGQGQPGVAA